jgi:hypothetical protein
MTLSNTISEYFIKHNIILVDRSYEHSDYDFSVDKWGLIHVHLDNIANCKSAPSPTVIRGLLHEFIYLDRFKTTGSMEINLSDNLAEKQIEKEVEQIVNQNSLEYRILKERLNSTNFVVEKHRNSRKKRSGSYMVEG